MTAVSDIEREINRIKRELQNREGAAAQRMTETYKQILADLQYEIDRLAQLVEDEPWRAETGFTQRNFTRLYDLLLDAQNQFASWSQIAEAELTDAMREASRQGWTGARSILSQYTGDLGFEMSINNVALQSVVAATTPGSPVRGVLDSYGDRASSIIEQQLTRGISQGLGIETITRSIANLINEGEITARIEALVRTEMMRAMREAQLASYRDIGEDVVPEWEWSAGHSQRTCLACLAMDGRHFPITTPFNRAHVNCRCVAIPVVSAEYLDPVERETGAQWFAKQPPDVQRSMLPSQQAYEAYRDGKIGLGDMVGERSDPVWGTSVYAKSGKQMLDDVGATVRTDSGYVTSAVNPKARRSVTGVWNEDAMPVEDWENSWMRMVIPAEIEEAFGFESSVLRWDQYRAKKHMNRHKEIEEFDFIGGNELETWTVAGIEANPRGSTVVFFEKDGLEWIASFNVDKQRGERVIRTMFVPRPDYADELKATLKRPIRRK